MRLATLPMLAFAVILVAGCEAEVEPSPDPEITAEEAMPSAAMQAQFASLRAEVDSVMNRLQQDVEARQEELTGDALEAWTDLTAEVADRRGDVLVMLDRIESATTVGEARSLRDDIASEVAEAEAEVAREEIRRGLAPTEVAQAVEERLSHLEQDLDGIASRVGMATGVQEQPPASPDAPATNGMAEAMVGEDDMRRQDRANLPDQDEIQELRNEIQEVRVELAELQAAVDEDEWEDRREDVSDDIADLTRQIRRHWYSARYRFDIAAEPGA